VSSWFIFHHFICYVEIVRLTCIAWRPLLILVRVGHLCLSFPRIYLLCLGVVVFCYPPRRLLIVCWGMSLPFFQTFSSFGFCLPFMAIWGKPRYLRRQINLYKPYDGEISHPHLLYALFVSMLTISECGALRPNYSTLLQFPFPLLRLSERLPCPKDNFFLLRVDFPLCS